LERIGWAKLWFSIFLFEFDQNSCKLYSLLNYSSKLSYFLFHLQLNISSEVRVQMHVLLQTLNWTRNELKTTGQDSTTLYIYTGGPRYSRGLRSRNIPRIPKPQITMDNCISSFYDDLKLNFAKKCE